MYRSYVETAGRSRDTEQLVLQPNVAIKKIRRDISTAEVPTEERGAPAPRHASQPRKGSSHNFSLWKPKRIVAEWDKGLLESQAFLLKGYTQTYLMTNSLALSSSTGAAAQKVPGTYSEELVSR